MTWWVVFDLSEHRVAEMFIKRSRLETVGIRETPDAAPLPRRLLDLKHQPPTDPFAAQLFGNEKSADRQPSPTHFAPETS